MTRRELLNNLSHFVRQIRCPHPIRVAIDGIDNAGKTTLADELALVLRCNRTVIRASIDGFHRTRKERHKRGALSPAGYYLDSFNNKALAEKLLNPLGPNGNLDYLTAVFDFRTDSPIPVIKQTAKRDAILLFDGVFLLRPELNAYWDFRIFVHISFETALQRALLRDAKIFGSAEETTKRYLQRYIPGQKLYLKDANPEQKADIVIDNNNPSKPVILRRTGMDM